ncbi:hypothetical protein K466DRAFT_502009 [Polyporus arcularius HHB13444]|uniref:Uncharacterized protein n=1 Tax=Polyporus arcularius HHB13444 TaxID=1314778 RepID=A0A5C3NVU7_9APHY|nr:hypothetical protein K466DRAFT_502009 [Polyporus arcularius HHB13444]
MGYFWGLPSSPRLVYRIGTPLTQPIDFDMFHQLKVLRPVFDRKLVEVWGEMGPRVVAFLDSKNVKFTTIDWVRFSLDYGPAGPVTLWIGVLPESLAAEDAHIAACGCLALLQEFDITDVEVAFRTSIYTRSAGPKLLEPVDSRHPTADVRGPLTPTLGLRVAAKNTPYVEGTGGFYFAEGRDSDKIFFVTARHFLFPPNAGFNDRDDFNSSAPRHDVVLLGTKAFSDMIASIDYKIERHILYVDRYRRELHALEKRVAKNTKQTARKALKECKRIGGSVREESRASKALGKLHDEVINDWADDSRRVLGHVICSPPVTLGAGSEGYTEDYAVVELDSSKIDKHVFRGNAIEFGTTLSSPAQILTRLHADTRTVCSVSPCDRLYKLHGHLREEDMHRPNLFNGKGEECLMVVKSGSGSGVTVGSATGIFSYVREYFDDGTHRTSREWAILPYSQTSGVFSALGDSGSLIADGRGRFGGLLTGGAGADTRHFDITYATPFFWLWPRIKANGFPDAHLDLDAYIDFDPDTFMV